MPTASPRTERVHEIGSVVLVARDRATLSGGHHGEYYLLLTNILVRAGFAVETSRTGLDKLFARGPLFFLMIEENPLTFALAAFARALIGRRTAGLLFRSGECVSPVGLRLRTKRFILRTLKRLPKCSILTILPFFVNRRFSEFATAGIFDPPLWDLSDLGLYQAEDGRQATGLIETIDHAAAGRKVILALGGQNASKGFDYLSDLLAHPSTAALKESFFFVVAGRVAPGSVSSGTLFAERGGLLIDRLINEAEWVALNSRADFIWCCYAPDYNQASSIFGRAVQYGCPTIVRAGAYLESLANAIGHPFVPISWGAPDGAVIQLLDAKDLRRPSEREISRKVSDMRKASLDILGQALGEALDLTPL